MEYHRKNTGKHRRNGEVYKITDEEIVYYHQKGYLVLEGVLSEEEMQTIDPWFDYFIEGKHGGMDRDFCDMSQPYGTKYEDFKLVNAMLPGKYKPEFSNNIFYCVAHSIAQQLRGDKGKAVMDYEQFLAKKPRTHSEFAMHQDLGYWPETRDTWTATFSLALSDSEIKNGCLQVVPGSNKEKELRKHRPKGYEEGGSRDDSHTLVMESRPDDKLIHLPVKRGSVTIHDERIVHGSGSNLSDEWRKTYVMAFRDEETVKEERKMGFTHSHNDKVNWEKILKH